MRDDVNREGCDNESARLYGSLRVIKSYPMNITYANARANSHSAPPFAACNRIALALHPTGLLVSISFPLSFLFPSAATDSPEYFPTSVSRESVKFTLANQGHASLAKQDSKRDSSSNSVPVRVEMIRVILVRRINLSNVLAISRAT